MDDEYGDDIDFTELLAASERSQPALENAPTSYTKGQPKVQQPKPQALPSRAGPSSILVNSRQKNNPILKHVRALPWEYADIPADYVLGNTTCALFLSLRYHRLHPEYIYSRIRQLAGKYNLRILLTLVDIENHQDPLKELSKTSLVNNFTLILCWSSQEAGRYLELYKSYEHASPSSIQARESTNYRDQMVDFITTPRTINKSDALAIVSNFGTIRAAVNAHPEEIAMVPGWGEKKVQQWYGTVREPFRVPKAAKGGVGPRRAERRSGTGHDVDMDDEEEESGRVSRVLGITPVPIGTAFSKAPKPIPENASNTQKRPATSLQLWEPEDDDEINEDEEEAYLLAVAAAATREDTRENWNARSKEANPARSGNEDKLGGGVATALAKLREV